MARDHGARQIATICSNKKHKKRFFSIQCFTLNGVNYANTKSMTTLCKLFEKTIKKIKKFTTIFLLSCLKTTFIPLFLSFKLFNDLH